MGGARGKVALADGHPVDAHLVSPKRFHAATIDIGGIRQRLFRKRSAGSWIIDGDSSSTAIDEFAVNVDRAVQAAKRCNGSNSGVLITQVFPVAIAADKPRAVISSG